LTELRDPGTVEHMRTLRFSWLALLVLATPASGGGTTQATPVPGVGDKAVYLVNQGLDQILNAKKGHVVVSLAAYNFTPAASEASLEPLVVEALGQL
jgi:hypothetical protein